ncbi:MAG TPA: LTA synthase family protein [Terriglobales bacterium]|nr:LTA synthase family protein [Terriglobales bacterium]
MNRVRLLIVRLGLLVLLYGVSRAFFLAFNFHSYDQVPAQQIIDAFLVGLRFDIAAICRINGPFIVCSALPFWFVDKVWYQRLLKAVFLLSNIPFLIFNVVDYEYFKFIGQRSSPSLLDMRADIPAQIGQLSFHYWYLLAIVGLFALVLYRYPAKAPPAQAPAEGRVHWISGRDVLVMIVIVAVGAMGARGGWQRRRFLPELAQVGDRESLSHLALNSTFTMLRTERKCDTGKNTKVNFFATDEELRKEFPAATSALSEEPHLDNVVIIIVESLSAEYTGIGNAGHSYTPFLDGLARRAIYFKNSFANGRRSIDAPSSILAGLPHLREETFYCAQHKHLYGLGSVLKEKGYHTSFFHGGKNGTMFFDVFSERMGFDRYYGLNEYPKKEDSDGVWGIYDEPMLQFMARELNQRKGPFASVLFTLSTHNPYKVPPQYQGIFPKGELPIHETVGYFDHALKKFFETAEKMPWYKNTLFVITGDHIGPAQALSPRMIDSYRVPLILFHPGRRLPNVNPDRITQHVDIAPSILDALGIATNKVLPFGHTIFDSAYGGLAIGEKSNNYWIADKNFYLEYRFNGPAKLFRLAQLDSPISDQTEARAKLERKLKAYVQWFDNGLAENNLYR